MLIISFLQGLQRILHLRQYNGRVSFVPAPGFETYGEPTSYPNSSTGKPDSCSASEEESIKVRHHGYQGPNIDLENAYGAKEGPL